MNTQTFPIRGINVCESLARHTPEQLTRLLQRMTDWGMNTLIVHPQYGYRRHEDLIRQQCQQRSITLVHYVYTSLAFLPGCPPDCFAKDETGRPRTAELECETRPCVSSATARQGFRDGARCADRGRRLKLHFISYIRRFALPADLSVFAEIDAVMFDLHLRWRWKPLGADHRRTTIEEREEADDPRIVGQPINRYLATTKLRDFMESLDDPMVRTEAVVRTLLAD